MNYQTIASHTASLKKIGLGILSAGIVTLATACTTFVVPAPAVAPVPTTVAITAPVLAPSANVRSQSHQLLETFRYTGQPALVAAPRTLEFFRYTTLADDTAEATRSVQPLEMFRYSEQAPAVASPASAKHSLEMFRYTTQVPAVTVRPLEIFRYTTASAPVVSATQPLEMFRYTAPVSAVASAQPLEMFRYELSASASVQSPQNQHSLETYRYNAQPRIKMPLSLPR